VCTVATPGPLCVALQGVFDKDIHRFVSLNRLVSAMDISNVIRQQTLYPFSAMLIQDLTLAVKSASLQVGAYKITANAYLKTPTHLLTEEIKTEELLAVVEAGYGHLHLKIPAALMKLQSNSSNKKAKIGILTRMLIQLYSTGWLIKQGDDYILKLQYKDDEFQMNGKPWLVPDANITSSRGTQ